MKHRKFSAYKTAAIAILVAAVTSVPSAFAQELDDELEEIMDPNVIDNLKGRDIYVNSLTTQIQKDGYRPVEVFRETIDQKEYRVWLE